MTSGFLGSVYLSSLDYVEKYNEDSYIISPRDNLCWMFCTYTRENTFVKSNVTYTASCPAFSLCTVWNVPQITGASCRGIIAKWGSAVGTDKQGAWGWHTGQGTALEPCRMTGAWTVAGRGGLTGCKGSKQEGHPSKDSDAGIQSTELWLGSRGRAGPRRTLPAISEGCWCWRSTNGLLMGRNIRLAF